MKAIYNPLNPFLASDRLSLGTPEGTVELIRGIPSNLSNSQYKWLVENSEEFKECISSRNILIESAAKPKPTETTDKPSEPPKNLK